MERHLERFMREGAGPDAVLIEDEAIDAIDRFALQHRLPNGKTVLDQFHAIWPDLNAAGATRWTGSSRSAVWTGTRSSC
jgi:hypothetical protein